MIKLVYYSGLTNGTFFAVSVLLLVAIIDALGSRSGDARASVIGSVARLARSPLLLIGMSAVTLVNVGFGIYKGYVVPRDFLQDVFSARSYLSGGSLYPSGMTQTFMQEMKEHPPQFSIWPLGSDGRRDEAQARDEAAASDWVQAHPPAMTLFFVPIVIAFGNMGSYLAISVLSLASLLAALVLIGRALGYTLGRVGSSFVVLAVLGWAPTIDVWRNGQSGLYLLLLIVAGWIWLRDGRPMLAGVAIGVATCLKLYPGILLVYLVLRHRAAFVSAVATIVCIFAATCLLCGPGAFIEYARTAGFVTNLYADYAANISLLGLLIAIFNDPSVLSSLRVATAVLSLAIALAAVCLIVARGPKDADNRTSLDLEFSLFLSFAPLMVPIAWEHYLVMLILPLAVLGAHAFGTREPRTGPLKFLVLLETLAVPFMTYFALGALLKDAAGGHAMELFLLKMRTFSMIWLSAWLAAQRLALALGVRSSLTAQENP